MAQRWTWGRWTRGARIGLALAVFAAAALAEGPPARTTPGRVIFLTYCASCHGIDGRGGGAVAAELVTAPPDLTRLSERYGMPLSRERLSAYIDGREEVIAHGPREMPVWGWRFWDEGDPDSPPSESDIRHIISVLIDYLESIQQRGSA